MFAFQQTGPTLTASPNASSVNADVAFGGASVLVTNTSANVIFVRCQLVTGAAAATAADTPILGGQAALLDLPTGTDPRVSVFCSAAATVYVTPGVGGI